MKRLLKYTMLVALTIGLSSSCSKDDDSSNNNDAQMVAEITEQAMEGLWIITSYIDSGDNETNDYNGYTFNFGANGVLTATNGNNTITGTWSVTSSDSNSSDDDDGSDDDSDIDFNIFFSVSESSVFEDLNDDWDVSSNSATQISLFDVSGGDGSTDTLVFGRN